MGKVKNLNGTADYKAKDGKAWLENWEKHKEKKASECYNEECKNTDNLVGAHVQKCGENTDNKWYIIPFCKSCNGKKSTEEFKVSYIELVAVNDIN